MTNKLATIDKGAEKGLSLAELRKFGARAYLAGGPVFGLVVITFIDLDHMIIPDVFSLSGIVLGLLGGILNPQRNFWDAFGGILMGGGFLWAVAAIYWLIRKAEGMGGGDIKLLAWLGAVLGWKSIPFVIIFSCVLGSSMGVGIMVAKRGGMKTAIPFGPYLALAGLCYIFFGQEISLWYLQAFWPWL